MTFALVALGGAMGACLRFLTDRWVQARHDTGFPWGTLVVNAVGSLLLGLLTGATLFGAPAPTALVGVGFCGALTTFSTFGYESVRLLTDGARLFAVLNVVGSVLAGLGSGAVGVVLAAAIWG
ncbi:putative fluoride ion transporter CrcB 2 [Saccharopolyspora subtropica]|uniref:Fluoride-specific ion channel FluC n=1 Tax=Saccharopolyspora thermophila TaxID=89367 RepID=A0A917K3T5_9PSEU|nr:fluoride efflux transporter CrcB [Saccharopolyspora subtropica]GGI99955.1 putative fluoride ion transporter CrcB 2 [Saccharopolyspora subtropica]